MHLITKLPSDTAIRDALIKEIKTGWELNKQKERVDEIRAAHEAKVLRQQKEVKGLGRCVAQIPADTYFLLQRRYGWEEINSKEFLKHWQKTYPHLSPHKL